MKILLVVLMALASKSACVDWQCVGLSDHHVSSIMINPWDGYATIATHSGIFWSSDRSEPWASLNEGLSSLSITSLTYTVSPFGKCGGAAVLAGTNDAGVFSWRGDTSNPWQPENDGLSDLSISIIKAHPLELRVYAGTHHGKMFKGRVDSVATIDRWNDITSDLQQASIHAISPYWRDTVYVLSRGADQACHLHGTVDGGSTWRQLLSEYDLYSIEARNKRTLWVGGRGRVAKTINGGLSWQFYTDGLPRSAQMTSMLLVSDTVSMTDTLYVGTNGYGVFKSCNGERWYAMNGGLIGLTVNCLGVWKDTLYAGTNRGLWECGAKLSVEEANGDPSHRYSLQVCPNTFSDRTSIRYGLPKDGLVTLIIHDLLGRQLKTLVNEHRQAGFHVVEWYGTDDSGHRMPSGTYFLRLEAHIPRSVWTGLAAGGYTATKKLCVVR